MNADSRLEQRARVLRHVTSAAVALAVLLAVAKLLVWRLSGSVALLASGVDSALDCSASLVNAIAVRYAMKPADEQHRFGHGKLEALAGLGQATLICVSASFVIARAVEQYHHPQPLAATLPALAVMTCALLATSALVLYQRRAIRLTGSDSVRADALHYASDIASNLAAISAVGLAHVGLPQADAWLALAIAVMTLFGALTIGWQVLQVLMDRELSSEVRERIRQLALAHHEVRGLHALRTRRSGSTPLIQFHLELDAQLPLIEANRIALEVSRALEQEFPGADVIIHQDPADQTVDPPAP